MTASANRRVHVAVLMGGPSHEHAISLRSGATVCRVLGEHDCKTTSVVIDKGGQFQIDGGPPQNPCVAMSQLIASGVDVAFPALHGEAGEDGTIQGFLELCGLPYTFSGVEASVLAMNKCAYKALLVQQGVPTAPFVIINRDEWQRSGSASMESGLRKVGLPAFLKQPGLGSSYGVHRVATEAEAVIALDSILSSSKQALWEKEVSGVELTAAVVGDAEGELEALPLVEIQIPGNELFDTKRKYDGTANEIVPANVSDAVRDELQSIAVNIHRILGCRSLSRTDAILTDEGLMVLETNTIPGLTSESLFPKAAGDRFGLLLREMVDAAIQRPTPFDQGDVGG